MAPHLGVITVLAEDPRANGNRSVDDMARTKPQPQSQRGAGSSQSRCKAERLEGRALLTRIEWLEILPSSKSPPAIEGLGLPDGGDYRSYIAASLADAGSGGPLIVGWLESRNSRLR